jgi:hypothetical protein
VIQTLKEREKVVWIQFCLPCPSKSFFVVVCRVLQRKERKVTDMPAKVET